VQAPRIGWALLLPGFAIHTIFGALSGFVSAPLIAAIVAKQADAATAPQVCPPSRHVTDNPCPEPE